MSDKSCGASNRQRGGQPRAFTHNNNFRYGGYQKPPSLKTKKFLVQPGSSLLNHEFRAGLLGLPGSSKFSKLGTKAEHLSRVETNTDFWFRNLFVSAGRFGFCLLSTALKSYCQAQPKPDQTASPQLGAEIALIS